MYEKSLWMFRTYLKVLGTSGWKLWTRSCLFSSAPRLVWQICFKKTEVDLELSTDADMLLIFKKCIRGGICHAVHRYAKANNEYINDYGPNTESSYLIY